jgi:hypothetical protein
VSSVRRTGAVVCRTTSLPFRDFPHEWVKPRKSNDSLAISWSARPCLLRPARSVFPRERVRSLLSGGRPQRERDRQELLLRVDRHIMPRRDRVARTACCRAIPGRLKIFLSLPRVRPPWRTERLHGSHHSRRVVALRMGRQYQRKPDAWELSEDTFHAGPVKVLTGRLARFRATITGTGSARSDEPHCSTIKPALICGSTAPRSGEHQK